MRTPFDILTSEKEPLYYIEQAKIKVKDGSLITIKSSGEVSILPVASILLLAVGHGVSISSDAACLLSFYGCHVCFVTKGIYVRSVWQAGKWSDPKRLENQFRQFQDPGLRLALAKKLAYHRFKKDESIEDRFLEKIVNLKTINELLGIEAYLYKRQYAVAASRENIDFKRDPEAKDQYNKSLNRACVTMYNLTTAVILAMGLHPSIGYIHGQTRRGGLTFDLADFHKNEIALRCSFNKLNHLPNKIISEVGRAYRDENKKVINELIDLCQLVAGERTRDDYNLPG